MNNIVTNELLTEDEVKELTSVLNNQNSEDDYSNDIDKSKEIENRFNNAMKYLYANNEKKFSKMPIKDIFKWFFYLGVNIDSGAKYVSIEDILKSIETEEFLRNISEIIKDPDKMPDNAILDIDDVNNKIKLISDCIGYDCSCSPQREDHCESEDDTKCVITIPMNRFNKLINLKGDTKDVDR